jgi:hypothetical protein
MQLARTDARLLAALGVHQLHDRRGLLRASAFMRLTLVVRLSADAHIAASPRDSQPFDELFLENLPTGFFATLTP